MVIALFGDSCTGKSTIAAALAPSLSAEVFSGKDYLKLAKSESVAAALFQKKLRGEETILYVISEKDQLALLPEGCVRVLVTAGLATIKERFAARILPLSLVVQAMEASPAVCSLTSFPS